jgi:hypothetical protein
MSSSTSRPRRRVHRPGHTTGYAFVNPPSGTPHTGRPRVSVAATPAIEIRAAAGAPPPAVDGRPFAGLGPYESRYEIARGYAMERSILLP